MKPEIKAKWLEALRSGEYKQTKERLATEDGKFCCLGVLCELALAEGITSKGKDEEGIFYDSSHKSMPPTAVLEWSNVSRDYGLTTYDIAELNDNGKTFSEIADIIEEQL